ncbi:Tim44 domain-containing protein [Parvularcula flava]|uniref:Calcium-binding protein n=1 Tax=Aquisalinus luteolus TaxID=1566827 RepID=A0A8J3A3R1_9PROT|nr:Tim44/TimA family putative adaptor protein [Aquisalinus luteolus]NHK28104.1 Tim44 domain-containing protein [Aquisalinus luteolus]GGH97469.1 calcium-binding protein [Aquisalinus luteolus]
MDLTTIIFAALAGFICYRLYTVLGTRGGHEPDEQEEPPFAKQAEDVQATMPEEPVSRTENEPGWAEPIRDAWPDFRAGEFLYGAKSAYEMIVEAFAGDRLAEVKPYLDPGVYRAFEAAVKSRRDAGQTSELNFVGIENASFAGYNVENGMLRITVDFRSDQVRVLRDQNGEIIEGDPNRIDLVRDRWTFARPLKSRDPNWILVETGGSAPDAS